MRGDGGAVRGFLGKQAHGFGMDVAAYLARIGAPVPGAVDVASLAGLHHAHLLRVPFENLDVHLGRPIRLDVAALHRKVVGERRGGFCYELNGLFAALLEALGFRVTRVSARVHGEDGRVGPPFDHLALLVDLEERWLCDVGFGDSFLTPLRLREGEQEALGHRFRLVRLPDEAWRLERAQEGGWVAQYAFSEAPQALADFAPMCHHHQTSPASTFTRKRVCTLATPEGRVTLRDGRLLVTRAGAKTERTVTPEEADALLVETFGMPGARWPRALPAPSGGA